MINRQAALKDLDRYSLKELTQLQVEDKYRMDLGDLIKLTEWQAKVPMNMTNPPSPMSQSPTEEVVIDMTTSAGQEQLAAEAVKVLIELLEPLDDRRRARVIMAAGSYFGVDLGAV